MRNLKLLLLVFVNFLLLDSNSALAEKKIIKIGTGSILEGYYAVGLSVCGFITSSNKDVDCEAVPTTGSLENLNLLKDGAVNFILVQSNVALDAFEAKGRYLKDLPRKDLRQVLNLYDEAFTVIAKDDDKIKVFADIAGKRISNGNNNSASTITYEALRSMYSFAKPIDIELSQEDYAQKICDGDIDVIMLVVGHPNALLSHIAHRCEIDFVAIERDKLNKFLATNKGFHKVVLTKGLYPGITEDQETVGVSAILVTTDKVDKDMIKAFENYFHKNISDFKKSNAALSDLDDSHFNNNFVLPKYDDSKEN